MKREDNFKNKLVLGENSEDDREIFDPDENLYNNPDAENVQIFPKKCEAKIKGQTFLKNDEKVRFDEI